MGQSISAASMIDALLFRCPFISNRTTMLYFVNRAIRYWDGQGSFTFNSKFNPAALVFGPNVTTANAPTDMDTGQDFYIYPNFGTPKPIPRKDLHDYGIVGVYAAAKVSAGIPDHYVVVGRTIMIYPGIAAGVTLSGVYHVITQTVADSGSSFTLFPDNFDDIIVDWGEAEVKRQFRIVGWEQIYGRVLEQGKMLVDQYRTDTPLQMGTDEAARKAQDQQLAKS